VEVHLQQIQQYQFTDYHKGDIMEPMFVEINCTTGEVTERPYTPEEIANQERISAEISARENARIAAEQAKAIAKASAEAKLAALGLTAEEISAL
jgi:hypothetical protein